MRRAVESAGISVRDYALTTMSMLLPGMVVAMEKEYGTKVNTADMTKDLKGAQLDNVKFVRANWTRISALTEEAKKYQLKEPEESSDASDAAEDEGGEEADTTAVSRPDRR